MNDKEIQALQTEYDLLLGAAERCRDEVTKQLRHLLSEEQLYLAMPIESRTKSWQSLREKIDRSNLTLRRITDLYDLIGVRLVFLFRRDVDKVCGLMKRTFTVISEEDTAARLNESQFGYSSRHYIITLPDGWLSVPTFRGLGGFKAEIQVRTAAQHIWAASSHFLQYKKEASVPPPVRRTINRVSALLETVDSEFEQILEERDAYIAGLSPDEAEALNVDALERALDALWPNRNKDREESERYSELLEDLLQFKIADTSQLRQLIEKHKKDALEDDIATAAKEAAREFPPPKEKFLQGYYFTHVGLTRKVLQREFGSPYIEYRKKKIRDRL